MNAAIDLIGLIGAASIIYGVYLLNIPTAFIIGGAMALTFTILAARKS